MNDCEFRTSSEKRTGVISGHTFIKKPATFTVIDGEAVFEGDIILGHVDKLESEITPLSSPERLRDVVFRGIGISGVGYRWPRGRIPYRVDPTLPNQARVTDAIRHWEQNTSIRFILRNNERNFVTFRPGNGCSSRIGMTGNEQFVTLGNGCGTGNTIHEIGHAVGLWHEQSREDRNNYVTVNYTNIIATEQPNFDQHITDGDDIGPYDYSSIMHYPNNAFAIDASMPTITPIQTIIQTIGQRNALSLGDILAVATIYGVEIWPLETQIATRVGNLYLIINKSLYEVNSSTRESRRIVRDNDWPQPRCMTACGDSLFVIDAGEGGVLWRVDPTSLEATKKGPVNDWPQPRCMTACGDALFVIDAGEGGVLWRVDPTSLVATKKGPVNDWPQPRCMTACGDALFVIDAGEGGVLWRVDPTSLVATKKGPVKDWPQPRCMTACGDALFVIDAGEGGVLWRVDPTSLEATKKGPINDWPQPRCMTACGGYLYGIDASGSIIWRVDPNSGAAQPM